MTRTVNLVGDKFDTHAGKIVADAELDEMRGSALANLCGEIASAMRETHAEGYAKGLEDASADNQRGGASAAALTPSLVERLREDYAVQWKESEPYLDAIINRSIGATPLNDWYLIKPADFRALIALARKGRAEYGEPLTADEMMGTGKYAPKYDTPPSSDADGKREEDWDICGYRLPPPATEGEEMEYLKGMKLTQAELNALDTAISKMGWPEIEAFNAELAKGQDYREDAGGYFLRCIRRLLGPFTKPRDPIVTHKAAAHMLVNQALKDRKP